MKGNVQNKIIDNDSTNEPTSFIRHNKASFGVTRAQNPDSFILPSIQTENRHSMMDSTLNDIMPNVSSKVLDQTKEDFDKHKLRSKIS